MASSARVAVSCSVLIRLKPWLVEPRSRFHSIATPRIFKFAKLTESHFASNGAHCMRLSHTSQLYPLASTTGPLAEADLVNGQLKEAILLQERTVVALEALAEDEPRRLASQCAVVGRTYSSNDRSKEAVQLLEHVVKIRRALPENNERLPRSALGSESSTQRPSDETQSV